MRIAPVTNAMSDGGVERQAVLCHLRIWARCLGQAVILAGEARSKTRVWKRGT